MAVLHNILALVLLGMLYVVSGANLLYDVLPEDIDVIEDEAKRTQETPQTFSRDSRSPTCGCCVQSRMTNRFCCDLCTKVVKRSDPGPIQSELTMAPTYPEKRMSSNCFCCKATLNRKCCKNCRYFV